MKMKINLTDSQKQMLVQAVLTAVVTLIIAVAAIFGYSITTPQPAGGLSALGLAVERITHPVTFQRAVIFDESAPITANSISIQGTPVIPFATPQTGFMGATAGQHIYCSSQNVIAAATVNPTSIAAAGISTPQVVIVGFGGAHAADPDFVTETHAGGGVTLSTWHQIVGATTTPQPATTAVAIDYCIVGTP